MIDTVHRKRKFGIENLVTRFGIIPCRIAHRIFTITLIVAPRIDSYYRIVFCQS